METPSIAKSGKMGEGIVDVPSFTEDGVAYRVHPALGACSCPRGRFTGHCEKHVALARSGAPLQKATRGMLTDGTKVIVLDAHQHVYSRRAWGFEAGVWQHVLCFDGERFVVESHRLLTGESFVRTAPAGWANWAKDLPVHANEVQGSVA